MLILSIKKNQRANPNLGKLMKQVVKSPKKVSSSLEKSNSIQVVYIESDDCNKLDNSKSFEQQQNFKAHMIVILFQMKIKFDTMRRGAL